MGEVFLAEDLTLGRKVALKLLPASAVPDAVARKRLLREARAAAALEHPNICAVYEIDSDGERDFISMQYIEGMTLAERIGTGPIPISEIVSIAVQIAEALAVAQGRAIIHRDIKPSNIMITPRGQVKVMDFGLAAMTLSCAGNDALADTALTRPGVVVGSGGYMSPEQVRGEILDSRSDIFALGIVIFEMAARRRAFESGSPAESLSAVLTHEPPPLSEVRGDIPLELDRIVGKALRKKREERYQSADDLAVDLRQVARQLDRPHAALATLFAPKQWPHARRLGAIGGAIIVVLAVAAVALNKFRAGASSPQPQIRSLAVLPLQTLSADPAQDYFADGMTEALITELAKIKALRVISRSSISQYKGTRKRLPEIGSELNVDAILEGSVARDAGRVRITAQLIHAPSDRHLWAESYDRDLRDVLKLQSEVARTIARQINIEVSPAERRRLTSASSIDPRANEAYLKGLYFFNRAINETSDSRVRDDHYEKSFQLYREAIGIEPRFAQAWARLAGAYHWRASGGFPQFYPQAKAAALAALEIDETNAEAHSALAFTIQQMEWDWPGAEREYRRAIELNPSIGHHGYAILLSRLGRHEEAIAEILAAERLDPLTLPLKANVARIYYDARQFEHALEKYRTLLELIPGVDSVRAYVGLCYLAQGNYAEAMSELQKAANSGDDLRLQAYLAFGYAVIGESKRALELVGHVEESDKTADNTVLYAAVYAALRQPDQAMRRLERAYERHDQSLPRVNVWPIFDHLRSDPRFINLMQRMNLGG